MENQIFSNISNFGRYVKKVESAIKTRILTLGKKYFRMLLWLQDLLKIISYTMEREKSSSIYGLPPVTDIITLVVLLSSPM